MGGEGVQQGATGVRARSVPEGRCPPTPNELSPRPFRRPLRPCNRLSKPCRCLHMRHAGPSTQFHAHCLTRFFRDPMMVFPPFYSESATGGPGRGAREPGGRRPADGLRRRLLPVRPVHPRPLLHPAPPPRSAPTPFPLTHSRVVVAIGSGVLESMGALTVEAAS